MPEWTMNEILPSAPEGLHHDSPSRLGTIELARISQMGLGLTVGDLALVSLTRIGLGPNASVQMSAARSERPEGRLPDRTPR